MSKRVNGIIKIFLGAVMLTLQFLVGLPQYGDLINYIHPLVLFPFFLGGFAFAICGVVLIYFGILMVTAHEIGKPAKRPLIPELLSYAMLCSGLTFIYCSVFMAEGMAVTVPEFAIQKFGEKTALQLALPTLCFLSIMPALLSGALYVFMGSVFSDDVLPNSLKCTLSIICLILPVITGVSAFLIPAVAQSVSFILPLVILASLVLPVLYAVYMLIVCIKPKLEEKKKKK